MKSSTTRLPNTVFYPDAATGRFVIVSARPKVAPPKKPSISDFLESNASCRKKVYLKALNESSKEQKDLIDRANRLAHT